MSDLGYERAYFERGFIAAYAWAATKLPSAQISDPVIDHAWDHRDEGMDEADRLPMPSANWRCFHCDEVFTDRAQAAQHFGVSEEQQPACQIKGSEGGLLRVLRETEDALFNATAALHAESADGLKAYRANLSRHAMAMQAAEELGYNRGLVDGRHFAPVDLMTAVDTIAGKLAAADGLDWEEVCGHEASHDSCDSSTCVAAYFEDHDPDIARSQYRRYARVMLGAQATVAGERKTVALSRLASLLDDPAIAGAVNEQGGGRHA